jgi:DMSO reductase anchor subunit
VDRESVLILISLKFALIVLGLIIMAFIKNKLNRRFALPAVAMSSLIAVVAEVIGRYSFFMLGA